LRREQRLPRIVGRILDQQFQLPAMDAAARLLFIEAHLRTVAEVRTEGGYGAGQVEQRADDQIGRKGAIARQRQQAFDACRRACSVEF